MTDKKVTFGPELMRHTFTMMGGLLWDEVSDESKGLLAKISNERIAMGITPDVIMQMYSSCFEGVVSGVYSVEEYLETFSGLLDNYNPEGGSVRTPSDLFFLTAMEAYDLVVEAKK